MNGVPGLAITSSLEEGSEVNEEGVFFIQSHEKVVNQMEIILTNNGNIPLELAHCEMMKRCRVFTLNDSKKVTDGMGKVLLKPGLLV